MHIELFGPPPLTSGLRTQCALVGQHTPFAVHNLMRGVSRHQHHPPLWDPGAIALQFCVLCFLRLWVLSVAQLILVLLLAP